MINIKKLLRAISFGIFGTIVIALVVYTAISLPPLVTCGLLFFLIITFFHYIWSDLDDLL